jgi:hypothetical protein
MAEAASSLRSRLGVFSTAALIISLQNRLDVSYLILRALAAAFAVILFL